MTNRNSTLFLGDSLTEWFDYAKYFPGKKIINCGIAGDTTSGVIHRLDDVLEADPGKLFLMIGVNDLFHRTEREKITANHQRILQFLFDNLKETQLLIQSMLPVNEDMLMSMKLNSTIMWLNENLESYCNNLNIRYLRLFDYFLSEGQLKQDYTTDGGHLSSSGYSLWAGLIRDYI